MASMRFYWTEQSKKRLSKIVETQDSATKLKWDDIALEFKKIYPNYVGQPTTIRKQYYRFKTENQVKAPNEPENFVIRFHWSDKAKEDLKTLVKQEWTASQTKDFSIVNSKFKQVYTDYDGNTQSLIRQYRRIVQPFKWTKPLSTELVRLVNFICVDGHPNWNKIWHTFRQSNPNFDGSKNDLMAQYKNVDSEAIMCGLLQQVSGIITDWDHQMDVLLAKAIGQAVYIRSAQIRDGRRKTADNHVKLSTKIFKELFKSKFDIDYTGSDTIILKHFYEHKEALNIKSYHCDDVADIMSNVNVKMLQAFASKNNTIVFKKLFSECCHNCGFLIAKTQIITKKKLLPKAINGTPRVEQMGCNGFVYCKDEKYITCPECYTNPDWQNDYTVAISWLETNQYVAPNDLRNLNEYEQNQIALCGGFYSLYKKQNIEARVFEHRQGESNIGKKRDSDYHNMFTTFYNVDRPQVLDSSTEKIKMALRWLRKNNRLYTEFISNYETIYGYLMSCANIHPEERIIQISKGVLPNVVGKDKMGLLIPADNVKIESNISVEDTKFGVQHPLQDKLKSIRNIISVNYSDPDLEAKRWPHLFPLGSGSWRRNSSLKQQTYVKHRLLGIDDRFRKCNEFMFFWYDRLIKERLSYYNNRQRSVNVAELLESLHVRDVRENINKYGSAVPSSIPGSKTYWRARCYDLLAMVRDLGKPDVFVTLTQNDNWLELQKACCLISQESLESLNKPIMQPAIGGKSVVQFPVETVVTFYRRLEMFMKSCVHNKNGPFGEVVDYWFRIEYQNRGALHCHMVIWAVEDTIPNDIVIAELPRYSGNNEELKHQTFMAREYVKAFQIHTCTVGGCKKENVSNCKYGFPFDIQEEETMNESRMGYTYVRHYSEDQNVVPYNLYALLCWSGHMNVQKVTSNGIEAYLCKYVSKPEKTIDIKNMSSNCDRFLKARVVGIIECCAHLLQYHQVGSSRKTIFLPCDFKPNQRMLKRKSHMPADEDSEEVYYETLLHKYLVRPSELKNMTYVDMFRFHDVVSETSNVVYTQSTDYDPSQEDSECEIKPKCDETQFEYAVRARKIKSQRARYVSCGYKYIERGKAAVPRWRFLIPFGTDSEKYYEQRLLMNIPLCKDDLNGDGLPFSEENISNTFIEECCLRGLVDSEETAKTAILGAVQKGFTVERVIEIATLFVNQSFVTKEFVDSIIIPWVDSMPIVNDPAEQSENEYGEELSKMLEMRAKYEPYDTFVQSMTDSQKNVMDWVKQKLEKCDQILAIISGGAGVGKSFITRALYSYFIEKKNVCILLATTGSAAHLISGTTVHYYLKIDIYGNKYLQPGTISSKIVQETDVLIIDEFSMLSSDVLDLLNECTKEFGKSKRSLFGGKHIFLIGDPCQLPAINKSVFSNALLNFFSILILKETVGQKEETFSSLLNRVRVNKMTEEDKSLLNSRYINVSNIDYADDALIVTATRKKMHYYNFQYIKNVPGTEVVIKAQDFDRDTEKEISVYTKQKVRKYVKNLYDEELIIKEGCIVRLLRNIDVQSGWVNSKRARVFRAAADGSYIVLQDLNDESKQLPLTKLRQPFKLGVDLFYRVQYPLILGYATTVHAVQGTTVTCKYYVDLDRSFWESGQAFVALSRPKDISQLFLLNTHFEKVYLQPYYKNLLDWMTEVDEIAIMHKPRCHGDFPLISIHDTTPSDAQVFPEFTVFEEKSKVSIGRPFQPPRNEPQCPKMRSKSEIASSLDSNISPRIYKLADAFNTACKSSSVIHNIIRFGAKFTDEVLNELNNTLGIHNVSDPLLQVEARLQVEESALRKWDEQKKATWDLFHKYCCQFQPEFEVFYSLILDLGIKKYSGQVLHNGLTHIYIDGKPLQPVRTKGDGRCFYHSVAVNLIGDQSLTNAIKIILAFVICNDCDIYDVIFTKLASSAANVLLKVLSLDCWADMEILTGMAYALQRPIHVVDRVESLDTPRHLAYNPLESDSEPIKIAHVKFSDNSLVPNHFIALLHDEALPEISALENTINVSMKECEIITLPDDDIEMLETYESDESL